ncbi:MAG: hypothetical protein QM699_12425 [Amaricoccus sp.]|uniref:hypothetical protein n=1 Tax=Amaricoccus sp. TaxID=1872485 RepID=UPI0039E3CE97
MTQTATSATITCQTAGSAGTAGRNSASMGSDASRTASIEIVSGATARQPNSAAVSA